MRLPYTRFLLGLVLVALPFLPAGRADFFALIRNPLLIARGLAGAAGVLAFIASAAAKWPAYITQSRAVLISERGRATPESERAR